MAERDAVEQESENAPGEGEDPPGASRSRASVDPLQVAREAFTSEQPDESEQADGSQKNAPDNDGSDKDGSAGSSLKRRLLAPVDALDREGQALRRTRSSASRGELAGDSGQGC